MDQTLCPYALTPLSTGVCNDEHILPSALGAPSKLDWSMSIFFIFLNMVPCHVYCVNIDLPKHTFMSKFEENIDMVWSPGVRIVVA